MKITFMYVCISALLFIVMLTITTALVYAHEESGTMHLLDNTYDPQTATIYKGEQIVFENVSSQQRWPDLIYTITPKHKNYEFASQQALAPGEKWVYKFPYEGLWQYKDKMNPNIQGKISVIVGRGYSHVQPQESQNWWDWIVHFFQSLFSGTNKTSSQ